RPEFKMPHFKEGIEDLKDLEADMVLEGIITNVTNFGAFVDIGVHHDGLIHISALSNSFIKDPRDVVKAGDVVKVKILEIDLKRKRIGLSMYLEEKPRVAKKVATATKKPKRKKPQRKNNKKSASSNKAPMISNNKQPSDFVGIMADAFLNARRD
ncbi:S1 RNA-binding domain-containing protein, partial [Candidatus Marithrix sp. Canyon 246]